MNLDTQIKESKKAIKRNDNIFTTGSANLQILENQIAIMLVLQEISAKLEDLE